MKSSSNHRRWALTAATASLLLAACGGGGIDPIDGGVQSPVAAAAATTTPEAGDGVQALPDVQTSPQDPLTARADHDQHRIADDLAVAGDGEAQGDAGHTLPDAQLSGNAAGGEAPCDAGLPAHTPSDSAHIPTFSDSRCPGS